MKIDPMLAATVAAVVDAGTLDAAARRLHVTPSAVSQRVKTLEDQLGRVLLLRTKPVRATPAGEVVVRYARQLTLLEHEALTEFGLGEGGSRVRVAVAVNADSLATWFLPPLARLAQRYSLDFDIYRDDQDFTAGLLESGTVMAAVTSQAAPIGGCAVTPLGVLRYEAVASPAWAERWLAHGLDTAALERAPFIDFDRQDDLQQSWLRALDVDPERVPRHYVPSAHDFARAIELGLGWGMLPAPQSAAPLADGRVIRLGGPPIPVPLYWQQWKIRSLVLAALAEEVVAEAAQVLEPASWDRTSPTHSP